MGGVDRTYRFTGCIVAMLAEHRQKHDIFHPVRLMIALYAEPCHLPAFQNPIHPHHTEIVFSITGGGTGAASDAPVQIHDHGPAVINMIVRRIKISFPIVSFRKRKRNRKVIHSESRFFMDVSRFCVL